MRKAQAEDWIEDLAEFDPNVVAAACREWRQTQTRRPMPAELRSLCVSELNQLRARADVQLIGRPVLTYEEAKARAAKHLAAGYSVVVSAGPGAGNYKFEPDRPNHECADLESEPPRNSEPIGGEMASSTFVRAGDAALAAVQAALGIRATPADVSGGGDRDGPHAGMADSATALDTGAVLRRMGCD